MIFWVRGGVAGQYLHLGVGATLRSFERDDGFVGVAEEAAIECR